jgi:hypothetical protein
MQPPGNTREPLPPGTAGAVIPLPSEFFQRLLAAAAVEDNPGTQIWTSGGSELLVQTGKIRVSLDDGLVVIGVPVSCDQVASVVIQIPFATGSKDSPAGMIAATEDRPRGPAAIVDFWGEALIAFAWRIFLTATTRAAAAGGVDRDGVPLVPAAITVAKDGVSLLPMARHAFDRRVP